MKGITLQYTEEERVFFSDVAGIGDAKVLCSSSGSAHVRCERRTCTECSKRQPRTFRARLLSSPLIDVLT